MACICRCMYSSLAWPAFVELLDHKLLRRWCTLASVYHCNYEVLHVLIACLFLGVARNLSKPGNTGSSRGLWVVCFPGAWDANVSRVYYTCAVEILTSVLSFFLWCLVELRLVGSSYSWPRQAQITVCRPTLQGQGYSWAHYTHYTLVYSLDTSAQAKPGQMSLLRGLDTWDSDFQIQEKVVLCTCVCWSAPHFML